MWKPSISRQRARLLQGVKGNQKAILEDWMEVQSILLNGQSENGRHFRVSSIRDSWMRGQTIYSVYLLIILSSERFSWRTLLWDWGDCSLACRSFSKRTD